MGAGRPAGACGGRRDLLLLQLRRARLADRDRRALEPDAARGAPGAGPAVAVGLPAAPRDSGRDRRAGRAGRGRHVAGPFGFAHGFNKVAGSNTYGPVSPIEALGVWPAANYRLDAVGGAPLAGLAGAIGALAMLVGVAWWVRRRELAVPIALGACVALYLASLPFSGDYSRAKALMIAAPLAMLLAVRPLLVELRRAPGRGRARLGAATRLALGAAGATRMGRARGRLHRRRGLLQPARPARRAGRAARPRRRAARLPADRARRAGALRRAGPLRRIRVERRRHPRAAGRVPRLGGDAEPREAVRHGRRLQPDRLRLLLPEDARRLSFT